MLQKGIVTQSCSRRVTWDILVHKIKIENNQNISNVEFKQNSRLLITGFFFLISVCYKTLVHCILVLGSQQMQTI